MIPINIGAQCVRNDPPVIDCSQYIAAVHMDEAQNVPLPTHLTCCKTLTPIYIYIYIYSYVFNIVHNVGPHYDFHVH